MAYQFNKNKTFKGGASLPVGGYVCKTVAAPKYQKWDDSQKKYVDAATFEEASRTVVAFDIAEGEFKDFYKKKFDEDDSADKTWKGCLYLAHPRDTDQWDTNEKKYNAFGAALEDSNSNCSFLLNNNKAYNGKMLGIVFGEHSFKGSNGEMISCAKPKSCYSVDDIRSGNFKIPKATTAKDSNTSAPTPSSNGFVDVPDGLEAEIPFD